jgi:hypothetical protein
MQLAIKNVQEHKKIATSKERGFEKFHLSEKRFIKLWHGWEYSPVFEGREDFKAIFKSLIIMASPVDTYSIKKGHKYYIKRGEFFTSIFKIQMRACEFTKVSKKNVETALRLFEMEGMITNKSYNGIGRLISVTNYSKYQDRNVRHGKVVSFDKHLKIASKSLDLKPTKREGEEKVKRGLLYNRNKKEKKELVSGLLGIDLKNKHTTFCKIDNFIKIFFNSLSSQISVKPYISNNFKGDYKQIILFLTECEATFEELEFAMKRIAKNHNPQKELWLRLFMVRLKEQFLSAREELKGVKALQEDLPLANLNLPNALKNINEELKKALESQFLKHIFEEVYKNKVVVVGLDGNVATLRFNLDKTYNYSELHHKTKFEDAIFQAFYSAKGIFIKGCKKQISQKKCGGFDINYIF